MSGLPENRIKKITVPKGSSTETYDIVPEMLGKNSYSAELPTLTGNSTIALTKDLPHLITLDAANGTPTEVGIDWTLTTAQYNECVDESLPVNIRVIIESGTDYYLHRYSVADGIALFSEIDISNDAIPGLIIKGIVANQSGTKTFSLVQSSIVGNVVGISVSGLGGYTPNSDGIVTLPSYEEGAEVNVQADWNQTITTADSYIKNKPNLGTAAAKNTGTSAGNVPVLDNNGKLDTSVLPALAVSETFTAANQAAMLALTAQVGDICVRTDETKTYILVKTPASTLANWKLLEHPADAVSSVNGKTGAVTIGFSLDSSSSTSTGAKQYVESISSTGTSGTKKYLHFGEGSTPSRSSFTYATGSFSTAAAMNFNTGTNTDTPYISAISGGSAVSPTTKYLHKSTTNVVTGVSGGSGSLTSGTESGTGKIQYIEDVSHTAASLTGTKTFNTDAIKSVALSASTTSTDGPIYIQSISGSAPSLTGTKTFVTGYSNFSGGSGKLEAYDAATNGTKKVSDGTRIGYVSAISSTAASASGTAKAGSETHTHNYDKTTGVTLTENAATADGRITYVKSISGGSGDLTSNDTASGGIAYIASASHTAASLGDPSTATVGISGGSGKLEAYDALTGGTKKVSDGTRVQYISDVTHTAASLTGTKTFVTGYSSFSGGSGNLASYDAATNGTKKSTDGSRIQYIHDVTHTAASLTGTKTFVTGYGSFSGGSGSLTSNDTSTDGIAYIASASHTAASLGTPTTASAVTSISGGSGSLEAYDAVTGGTKKVSNGTRIGYLADVTHTAATLTGTKTFVTGYSNFSGGSGNLTSDGTEGTNGIEYIKKVSFENGVLTLESAYLHHTHSGASLGTASTGTVGISGGSISKTTYYLAHSHTGASSSTTDTFVKGYPDFSGGSASHTTKYLHHSHSGASLGSPSTGTVGISGGSISKTTYYLDHTHNGAFLGDPSTGTVGISGGSISKTTYYLEHGHTAASLTGTKTFVTGYPDFSGGSGSHTTKYLHHSHTGASATTKYLSAAPSNTSTASESPSATTSFVTGVTGGTTSATTYYLAHGHTAASLGTASTGTVGIENGEYTATSKYMKATGTAASTGTVGISGGSISKTTKYLTHTHNAASASGTVDAITGLAANASSATGDITMVESVSGGSAVSATTKYMKFMAPVLATDTAYQITGVGSVPSLELNDTSTNGIGVITAVSGGTTTATTKYLKVKEN